MSKYVEVYDPASPNTPKRVLRGNFDPRRHVRFTARPAVQRVPLGELAAGESPVLTERQAEALNGAAGAGDHLTFLDLARLGVEGVSAVRGGGGRHVADALFRRLENDPRMLDAAVAAEAATTAAGTEQEEHAEEQGEGEGEQELAGAEVDGTVGEEADEEPGGGDQRDELAGEA